MSETKETNKSYHCQLQK